MKQIKKVINGKDIEVKIYSTDRTRTSSDKDMDTRVKEAVYAAIKKSKESDIPIARYDKERNQPYFEYPNGEKVYG